MDARFGAGLLAVIILAIVIGLVAARSQSQTVAAPPPTSAPTPIPTPGPHQVNIVPNASGSPEARYDPATITVRVGQRVTWVNTDSIAHTATSDDGTFNTGVLAAGERGSWTPRTSGTYTYGDFLHPDMHGTVVVQP